MVKDESGRSMVEMLAVLAIIGVLSIMGIYGYVQAMRKHRANEISYLASILAVDAVALDSCVKLSNLGLEKPQEIEEMIAYPDPDPDSAVLVNIQFKNSVSNYNEQCNLITAQSIYVDVCGVHQVSCRED